VDWAAHMGGLAAGFCIGVVLFALELRKLVWKIVWLAIGVVITAIYFSVTFTEMYSGNVDPPEELRDVCDYYKQYFDDYECKCMINQ
jgi:phosphotransferase system  glucose/maltose/N-acetylglucosamine-specific IIC component